MRSGSGVARWPGPEAGAVRILIVTNLFRPVVLGGYERGCAEFADWAAARGHELAVLTTDLTDDPPGAADPSGLRVERRLESYRRIDGSFRTGSLRWRLGIERRNAAVLAQLLGELRPDVVMWWNLGGLNLSLVEQVRRAGVAACGIVNDHWLTWAPSVDGWGRAARRVPPLGWAVDRALGVPRRVEWAAAARWVFVSDDLRAEATHAVGLLPQASVVHSGIDPVAFPLREAEPAWSDRLLFVGRITANKGADRAVDALHLLPGATLTLCGPRDVSLGPAFDGAIDGGGLRERVRFVEHADPRLVADEHRRHDVALFPGRWAEPWGKAPLEAMASGLPVVLSAKGGPSVYARDGENCLVAAEPAELAAAVSRLRADPDLRARLVRAGRETALRYTVERSNEARLAVLEQVIAAADPVGPAAAHQAAPRARSSA